MVFALVAASVAASPAIFFVETIKADPERVEEAKIWSEQLAHELRRWGARVTTQEDMVALAGGTKQRQTLGCEDVDCGLDGDVLNTGDGHVSGVIAGTGPYLVSLKVMHMRSGKWDKWQAWVAVSGEDSYRDPAEAIRELVPKMIAIMRKDLQPGRLRDQPVASADVGGPPAATPRRCSVAPGETALALVALLLGARRRRATSSPCGTCPSAAPARAYDPRSPSRAPPS